MKKFIKSIIVILFAFFLFKATFAQPVEGKKFELSTSVSIWNIKMNDGETETLVNIPLRIGYYIYRGLEIEPEFLLTIPEDSEETGYLILGNLVYNFKVSENLIPFILAGGGYGNGTRFFDAVFDSDMGITVLNFGVGMKYLVGDSAAIRTEYRFTKYSGEETETGYWGTYTYEYDRTDNNVFVGVSIFF